jgi:hypothetical protein
MEVEIKRGMAAKKRLEVTCIEARKVMHAVETATERFIRQEKEKKEARREKEKPSTGKRKADEAGVGGGAKGKMQKAGEAMTAAETGFGEDGTPNDRQKRVAKKAEKEKAEVGAQGPTAHTHRSTSGLLLSSVEANKDPFAL